MAEIYMNNVYCFEGFDGRWLLLMMPRPTKAKAKSVAANVAKKAKTNQHDDDDVMSVEGFDGDGFIDDIPPANDYQEPEGERCPLGFNYCMGVFCLACDSTWIDDGVDEDEDNDNLNNGDMEKAKRIFENPEAEVIDLIADDIENEEEKLAERAAAAVSWGPFNLTRGNFSNTADHIPKGQSVRSRHRHRQQQRQMKEQAASSHDIRSSMAEEDSEVEAAVHKMEKKTYRPSLFRDRVLEAIQRLEEEISY
jgi:hypothetical protein